MSTSASPEPERLLLTGSRFRVVQIQQPTAHGFRPREIVRHPGAVVLLPLVDDEHVCLIRNFRPSIQRTLIELPAGTLEPPEAPEVTARRELREETGYEARQWELLHTFYPSPGVMDERMYLFVASGLEAGPAAREPGEEIENLIVSWQEAFRLIDAGEIQDAKTLVGLMLYARRRR